MDKWGKLMKAQVPQARKPKLESHCTLQWDPYQDPRLEQLWLMLAFGKPAPIESQCLITGK